jgi:hypothetical protein
MWMKIPLAFCAFLVFALLQQSFLPYFNFFGGTANLVFILFFVLIFFEDNSHYKQGFFLALMAGFFLDLISPFYFGASIISLIIVYFFKNGVDHFLKEWQSHYLIFYFIAIFSTSFLLYNGLLYAFGKMLGISFSLDSTIFINLAYNTILACMLFYFYGNIANIQAKNSLN